MKLFIFKAVGSYFGGACGASAYREKEAFQKVKDFVTTRDGLGTMKCYFELENDRWGWKCIGSVETQDPFVFAEWHDG